ncbi:MAG: PCMD domain-containing protein, partial [Candidatus Cryptobacteroides sp.]
KYTLGFKYTETDGILDFKILVDDSVNTQYDDIIFIASTTGLAEVSKYDIWAGHVDVSADVDESEYDPEQVYIEYRAAQGGSWVRIPAERESEGTFSKAITGLAPDTEYELRLVLTSTSTGDEEIIPATSTVTTDKAPSIPNAGMETTSNDESSKYKSLYDPSSPDKTLQTKWWDSGNAGSTLVGSSSVICYPDQSDKKEGTQSMCLQSRYVVVKFAAGNLFTGRFGDLIGTSGGTVYFGRPFTGRPTALRVWAKYSGGQVNRVGNTTSDMINKGDYDRGNIRIALGTWDYKKYGGDADSPVLVNTTDVSTFVDFTTDASTIAYGEKIFQSDEANSTNVWQQITIPLDYKTTTRFPTHIIISCAASMYGDYFTGCDESKMWVDGFELLYE